MVSQIGVDCEHPSKGRPGRDPDLDRLKSIGPRQMRWVVLKKSVKTSNAMGVDLFQYRSAIITSASRGCSVNALRPLVVNMDIFSLPLTSGLEPT